MSPASAPSSVERVVPSTDAQRDIWMINELGAEGALSYCMSLEVDIRGTLDRAAARAALQALYERHDALRATFSDDGAQMRIHRAGPVPLEELDFSALAAGAREAALHERLRLSVARAIDLRAGPVFRVELIALALDHHVAILRTHQIVCDGWALGVVLSDFARLYEVALGTSEPLPPASSFADFAESYAAAGSSRDPERIAFWKQTFEPLPAPLELPSIRQHPPIREFASARMDYALDADVMERVAQRAQAHGQRLYSTLLAAFAFVLARISGNPDVVVGVPAAAQLRSSGDRGLVGYCIDFLPVRCTIDPMVSFLALVERVHQQLRAALGHRGPTFSQVVTALGMRRDPSRLPLATVMFTSLPLPPITIRGAHELRLAAEHVARDFENFELLPNVFLADGKARVECQYATTLYDEQSVRGWFSAFENLLAAASEDFTICCERVPLIPAAQRARIDQWNATAAEFDWPGLIHECVERSARAHPERIAVTAAEATLTYGELEAQANRLARILRDRGAGRGTMLGLLLERGAQMVVAELAILKTGAAYVPLDPAYPRERLVYMLEQCEARFVVTNAPTRDLLATLSGDTLPLFDLDHESAAIAEQSSEPLERDARDALTEDPAYVVYTSGSTGRPKGVIAPHRAVVNFLAGMLREPGLEADDRVLALTTLSFDPAVHEIFGALCAGARIVVATRDQGQDVHLLRELIERESVTWMLATPTAWRMLLDTGWQPRTRFKALTGSEALRPDLARELLERTSDVWNMYGPTETTVWATCWKVTDPAHGIAVGRPVANASVWVLDEGRQLCPIGVPGEIYIGGRGMALGYIRQPELTAERFLPDVLGAGTLYRTGDRGRWRHDGVLELIGRIDFQLKIRGHRIEPGEIETVLAQHPAVESTVVVARDVGPQDTRLVAYVVCTEPAPAAHELRDHLRRVLPDYMVPQHVVQLHTLPRLPNGKVDRKALPAPEAASGREFVAPRTRAEIAIAEVWRAVLGADRIGVTDNFFDLGGHSLLAANAVVLIERALGVRVTVRQMVYDSLASIASTAEREMPAAKPGQGGWLRRLLGLGRDA